MVDREILDLASELLDACKARSIGLCLAESCTGGLIGGALTEIPGSSAVVDRGYVTYSNWAKAAALNVPKQVLQAHGAVSEPTARAMAEGALAVTRETSRHVALSLAVTGIAGPGGGSDEKPEGRVHFAAALKDGETVHLMRDFGPLGRSEVRRATVMQALSLGLQALGERPV